jgi:hypothetical protein
MTGREKIHAWVADIMPAYYFLCGNPGQWLGTQGGNAGIQKQMMG